MSLLPVCEAGKKVGKVFRRSAGGPVRTAYSPVSRLVEVHPARKSLRSALGRRTEASSWRAEFVRPQQLSTLQRGSRGMGLTPLPGRKQFLMVTGWVSRPARRLTVQSSGR